VIIIEELKKSYRVNDKVLPILDIGHLKIEKGEQVAIIGPSGCGKSTLLHIIAGVITPDQGKLLLYDEDITLKSENERDRLRRNKIGYIFQDFHLIPSLTVEENIRLVLPNMKKDARDQMVGEWLDQVGLSERRKHLPSQLSRGQQQRVAIVRSLIHKPDIVLADEPTGSLDFETANKIMDLLLYLCLEKNQTLLCVTHDLPLSQRFPKKIDMNEHNKIIGEGRNLA
jgi:putative ABC transport system ATP-binding protein